MQQAMFYSAKVPCCVNCIAQYRNQEQQERHMEDPRNSRAAGPTREVYDGLMHAYEHFNRQLFNGELPPCVITLQREKRTFGYFSKNRFATRSGQVAHEIALNPCNFGTHPIVEPSPSREPRAQRHTDPVGPLASCIAVPPKPFGGGTYSRVKKWKC